MYPPLFLAFALTSCAYYSTSSGIVGGIRSVAIPTAENETAEFEIGELLSERTESGFTSDGQLRVVDEESADALLLLRIVDLEDDAFTYTATQQTEQYRFKVLVDVELMRMQDGNQLLQLEQVEGWGVYDATMADEEGRDLAIETALEMIVDEVVGRTTSSW